MRCNAGINAKYLTDQHLIAEYRELLIPYGQMIKINFKPSKSKTPDRLKLGAGHVLFWRSKQKYLHNRFNHLVSEMIERGFKPKMKFWDNIKSEYYNDWTCSSEESDIIKDRISSKLRQKPDWYRYNGQKITDIEKFIDDMNNSKITY